MGDWTALTTAILLSFRTYQNFHSSAARL